MTDSEGNKLKVGDTVILTTHVYEYAVPYTVTGLTRHRVCIKPEGEIKSIFYRPNKLIKIKDSLNKGDD